MGTPFMQKMMKSSVLFCLSISFQVKATEGSVEGTGAKPDLSSLPFSLSPIGEMANADVLSERKAGPNTDLRAQGNPFGKSLAQEQFQRISQLTFQIKTSVSRDAAKASYGTGFVIDRKGLLATNFHVVESSLSKPKKYKTFLVDGKENIPATVVAFDSVNDLAIVKVDREFSHEVLFNSKLPTVGEKLFSLGVPEDLSESVIEGIFNGLIEEGPYRKLLVSSPLNSGMSGGPTVDQDGRLVGINVSIYRSSQNISFSVPADELKKLWDTLPEHLDMGVFELDVSTQMESSLNRVSAKLLKEYLAASNAVKLNLGNWYTKGLDPTIKCWRSVSDNNKELWEFASQKCRVQGNTQLHGENYGGKYTIDYFTIKKNKQASSLKYYHWVNSMTNSYVHRSKWVKDYYTKYHCQDFKTFSNHHIAIKAKVCATRYIRFKDVYDGFFQIVANSDSHQTLIVRGSAVGFKLNEIQKVFSTEIKAIGFNDVSNSDNKSSKTRSVH